MKPGDRDKAKRAAGRCHRCVGTPIRARRLIGADKWQGLWWCPSCERAAFSGASFFVIAKSDISLPDVTAADYSPEDALGTCAVCGCTASLESHHLAPKAIFGDRADDWPTVDVCKPCHDEWHRVTARAGLRL